MFMNSENTATLSPNSLMLNFTDKTNLRRGESSVALSNLRFYYTWRNNKKHHTKTKNSNYQEQHEMENLSRPTASVHKQPTITNIMMAVRANTFRVNVICILILIMIRFSYTKSLNEVKTDGLNTEDVYRLCLLGENNLVYYL